MRSLFQPIGRAAASTIDLVVPPKCLLCDALSALPGGCCAACWKRLRFIDRPFCDVSGAPFSADLGEGTVSPAVIANPPAYDRARSALIYDNASKKLVTRLKYGDRLDLAPWMADWMVRAGREMLAQCDLIIPVPLHVFRRYGRRFNQSAELARNISRVTGITHLPQALRRVRPTRRQVGLSGSARHRNVAGAFRVPTDMAGLVNGRRVMVIDDVLTSGATVNAAARALKRAGAAGVDILTFARVDPTLTEAEYFD